MTSDNHSIYNYLQGGKITLTKKDLDLLGNFELDDLEAILLKVQADTSVPKTEEVIPKKPEYGGIPMKRLSEYEKSQIRDKVIELRDQGEDDMRPHFIDDAEYRSANAYSAHYTMGRYDNRSV